MNQENKQSYAQAVRRYPRLPLVPKGEELSSKKIFEAAYCYVTNQIHFSHSWQPVVVTLWAMGTYLYRQFPCYGHLWLNSPTTHSGKTKLLNVLHVLCYRAIEPQLEPTSAVLFRFPSAIGGTLLLDEIDNLDPKRRSDVISVLNHYYANGSVTRAVPGRKKKFEIERFPIYCPKVIAGIESLPVTLQDRCIRIVLHRKKRSEQVQRFLPEDYQRQEPLRNQLEEWSDRKAGSIIRAFQHRERLGLPSDVDDDRVRDILEPLFAVASVLPNWVREKLVEGASEICRGRKSEESEANPVVAALQILKEHFPKDRDVWALQTEQACELLGEIPGMEDKSHVQAVLRKIGFSSRNTRIGKKVLRAYRIPRKQLERLCERYR